MSSVTSGADRNWRRRLTNSIKESLRELNIQLAQLNRQVSSKADLCDGDPANRFAAASYRDARIDQARLGQRARL
jgi:hypothetical protein